MVHLGSSAPNCTVHLGASELMRTRIKVLIRPLAPNRTVHLGASERLIVCVEIGSASRLFRASLQGFVVETNRTETAAGERLQCTSARIAAKTFRLQLSYTKIMSS